MHLADAGLGGLASCAAVCCAQDPPAADSDAIPNCGGDEEERRGSLGGSLALLQLLAGISLRPCIETQATKLGLCTGMELRTEGHRRLSCEADGTCSKVIVSPVDVCYAVLLQLARP